jgi:hypothetical protein
MSHEPLYYRDLIPPKPQPNLVTIYDGTRCRVVLNFHPFKTNFFLFSSSQLRWEKRPLTILRVKVR